MIFWFRWDETKIILVLVQLFCFGSKINGQVMLGRVKMDSSRQIGLKWTGHVREG